MIRVKGLIAASVCAAALAQTAVATVTLTQDLRSIEVSVDASDLGGSAPVTGGPLSPSFGDPMNAAFDTLTVSSPLGSATGRAITSQVSSLDASPNFMMATASGMSSGNISADFDFNNVSLSAESLFRIQFNLSSMMTYSLTGTVDDGTSGSTGRVRLRPIGGSDIDIQNTTGAFNFSGSLAPGDYEVIGEADIFAFVQDGGFFNKDASYDLTFTLIPEPATGLLAMVGCTLIVRRSRRRN